MFVALGIDKDECLKEVEKGDSSAASFMASVDERICEKGIINCMKRDLVVWLNFLCIKHLAKR